MKLLDFPIVKITIWLTLGILAAIQTNPSLLNAIIFVGIAILLLGTTFYYSKKKVIQNGNFAIAIYFTFFQIGLLATVLQKETYQWNHYTKNEKVFIATQKIQLVITEKLKSSAKMDRYFAEVTAINQEEASGKILLNIAKKANTNSAFVGQKLLLEEKITRLLSSKNPNQFDYSRYLEHKSVYGQIYSEYGPIAIHKSVEKNLLYYTAKFRNTISHNLANAKFPKESLALVNALILGQQQDISPEIIRDYQYAGAIHILSVSGLHVGFILLFITFLVRPIPDTKLGGLSKLGITLISLWLFAFVAGLAPSVLRSTVMFSFVTLGMYLKRETNTFHTVIVSLFLILLFRPLYILDIGFQLSYLAVIFILWLQPILQKFYQPKNKILNYFWDILTVSVAAQLGTLPLSIYYFHQFPGLFFVTNLVLIPFLSVIMVLGTLLVLAASIDWIPQLLAKVVSYLIGFMNIVIHKIANVEMFLWRDIPFSTTLLILSYIMLVSWIVWMEKPKFQKLVVALASIIVFQSTYYYTKYNHILKEDFIVFHSKKSTVLGKRKGGILTVYSEKEIVQNSLEAKMIDNYCTANFIQKVAQQPLLNTIFSQNQKILLLDSTGIYNTNIAPDILVVTNSPKVNLDRLLEHYNPKCIVADGSNYKSYNTRWEQTCIKKNIPFHNTYEKGYYTIKP